MEKKSWCRVLRILLLFLLTGCGAVWENGPAYTAAGSGEEETTAEADDAGNFAGGEELAAETGEQLLQEKLDALVTQLAFKEREIQLADLSLEEKAADFPAELIRQLQEALAAGTSDALLQELDDSGLRIRREDFAYEPHREEELSGEEEKINEALADQTGSGADSYDFYRLDMDQDGQDEILMVEHTRYEYSHSSTTVVLEQDETGAYQFAGYDYAGYYRLYAVFSYEGTYYMVCNYDDYKRETTEALGLFDLSGEARGFMWQIHQEHLYLRRSSTSCEMESLWTDERTEDRAETDLQSVMWDYIQEIGLDLMLFHLNGTPMRGAETEWSEQALCRLTEAFADVSWRPDRLGYVLQRQQWLFILAEQQVYFALYYQQETEQYLLEAFLYEGDEEWGRLTPIALYGITPRICVAVVDYWDMEDGNEEVVHYRAEDAEQAFPGDRAEVAAELWQQVNGSLLKLGLREMAAPDAGREEQPITGLVPEGLVVLAQEVLLTGNWLPLDDLAETLELTDQESVYESFFAEMAVNDWPDEEYFTGYVNHIYQYDIGEERFLLLVTDSGGSAGFADISCFHLTEEKPEYLDGMGTLDQDACVVPYEGKVYLVDGSYNYYSKYFDTVYLYPLTPEGISEQAVEVTLKPAEYFWTEGFQREGRMAEQIDRYVKGIGAELMEASPINDDIFVYTGCEELEEDPVKLQRLPPGLDWYTVDENNDGRMEYLARHHWFPSNYTTLYLMTEQYRLEEITRELQEAWETEYPFYGYERIQQWYQKFDGKIYTFRLFLTEGYNYYLNVSLCEEEEISWIASYYITPRCELQVQLTGQENTGKG